MVYVHPPSYRHRPMKIMPRVRTASLLVFALSLLCARAAGAQTWEWPSVVRTADGESVNAESRVVLTSSDLAMTYSASVNNRGVPITSCRASLGDIASVRSMDNGGKLFLIVVLKPQHPAICNSGSQPIALIPITDDANVKAAVTTITRACCQVVAVAASSRATPAPRPTASLTPPAISPVDWVESEGLFAFVRVRNQDRQPVTIIAGQILNCHDVASGCGRFIDRPLTLAPGAVMTLATVMSGNSGNAATFSYRYQVQSSTARFTKSAVSRRQANDPRTLMSAQEVRAAEAAAIGRISVSSASRIPSAPRPPRAQRTPAPLPFVAPKLVQRGSTRLGIGQRGLAVVRVGIGRNGMAQYATIVSINNRGLVAAALETAVSSMYAPAMRYGRPVDGNYVAEFQFDGSDPALASIPAWKRSPIPSANPSPSPSPSPRASASASPVARTSPASSSSPSASPTPSSTPTPLPNASRLP
jgi:hypothetical protein